jgi:hypothetical protein
LCLVEFGCSEYNPGGFDILDKLVLIMRDEIGLDCCLSKIVKLRFFFVPCKREKSRILDLHYIAIP